MYICAPLEDRIRSHRTEVSGVCVMSDVGAEKKMGSL